MSKKNTIQKIIFGTIVGAIAGVTLYLFFTPKTPHKPPQKTVTATQQTIRPKTYKNPIYPETIPGKIITLKKMTLNSAFDYYKMFSEKVRKGLGWPKMTFGEIEYNVRYDVNRMKKGLVIAYNIWDNNDNKMIGSIQIREKDDEDPGQLGMWLNENYWGGGRIQEAQYLISRTYFKAHPEAKDYITHVRAWNHRSYRSLEKFGHIRTETLPDDGEGERYVYTMTPEIIKEKAHLYE